MRRHFPYMCGKNILTQRSCLGAPIRGEALHKSRKFQQIRNPENRASLPHGDFGIRGDHVGPLRRNRANSVVVDAQQVSLAGPVLTLADEDKLPSAEWMERVGYADKLCQSGGNVCILS